MPDATFASILESCGRIDCLALFEENEISIAQLAELTLEDLKEIGIDKLGHRKSILAAIQAAFAESAPPASGGIPAEGKAGPAPADATAAVPCDASQRPKVFLSYGRKDAREVAERIERDLIAAGYEVWLDVKRIGSGSQWQQEIEQGLRDSQVVVSLLSPHAVRTVGEDVMDSVCLDELTFARTSCPPTPVVPAMVVPCEPPFIIYRLDYVHLTGWRAWSPASAMHSLAKCATACGRIGCGHWISQTTWLKSARASWGASGSSRKSICGALSPTSGRCW